MELDEASPLDQPLLDHCCALVGDFVDKHSIMDGITAESKVDVIRVIVCMVVWEIAVRKDEKVLDQLMQDVTKELISRLPKPRSDVETWS